MQKLGLISSLWAALLLFPLTSFALGLGEIEASSYLNQPLTAEIEVISARPGEIDDLLISLASRDAFAKAGLDRPAELSKLRFKVEKSEDGQSAKILVTTKKPIKEPFLSFLVEADWAKGRLLREFTILLDPMSFAQQAVSAPKVAPEQPKAIEEPQSSDTGQFNRTESSSVETQAVESDSQESVAQPIAMTPEPSAEKEVPYVADDAFLQTANSDNEIVVTKGDTLWGIASLFKDESHSMAQIMLAMQMLNPDAFGKDNINNLKVGAVLRVPDMDVLDKITKQEAYAQVLEQNGLWDEYVARKSGSTTTAVAEQSTVIDSGQQEEDSQLSLLTADEGNSDSASLQNDASNDASNESSGQIRKQLALAEEELEAARLENNDLKSRIEILEQQQAKIEELERLVKIKDSTLAQLQQTVSNNPVNQPTSESQQEIIIEDEVVNDTTGEEVLTEDTTQAEDNLLTEDKPSDVMIEAAGEIMSEEAGSDQITSEQTAPEQTTEDGAANDMLAQQDSTEAETVIDTANEGTTDEQAIIEQSETATVPVPEIITQGPEDQPDEEFLPSTENLLTDPVMLGGIGAILALLIGFIFLKKRNSADKNEGITIETPDDLLDDDATPIHVPSNTQVSIDEEEGDDQVQTEVQTVVKTAVMDSEENLVETVVSEVSTDDEEDEFSKTAIVGSDELIAETDAAEQANVEQDDVLNEVDVYLAYGLYDNAEDLLTESLQNSPDRADYRSKLLDTHFATKNAEAFIKEAEILKSMGSAANRFWDRVQIMGFELAPENELFSGAKDSKVSVEDLEYAKPESADFDISVADDSDNLGNTDFNLGDDFETVETQSVGVIQDSFSETQDLDDLEELDVDLPDEDANDLPDEIVLDDEPELDDELVDNLDLDDSDDENAESGSEDEFDIGDDLDVSINFEVDNETDDDLEADDVLSFDLPDDLDLSSEDEASDDAVDLEPTVEAPPSLNEVPPMDDDEAAEVDLDDSVLDADDSPDLDLGELTGDTMIMDAEEFEGQDTIVEDGENLDLDADINIDDNLDFDMSDMDDADLQSGQFSPSDTLALSPADEADKAVESDEVDQAETEESNEDKDFDAFIASATDEVALAEIDASAGLDKTGTFAPGDFLDDEPEMITSIDDIEDIEDLMLPDDVDEVGTKLDLAKAFIDMGDAEGARSSLEEVLAEGSDEQKAEARGLLEQIK